MRNIDVEYHRGEIENFEDERNYCIENVGEIGEILVFGKLKLVITANQMRSLAIAGHVFAGKHIDDAFDKYKAVNYNENYRNYLEYQPYRVRNMLFGKHNCKRRDKPDYQAAY